MLTFLVRLLFTWSSELAHMCIQLVRASSFSYLILIMPGPHAPLSWRQYRGSLSFTQDTILGIHSFADLVRGPGPKPIPTILWRRGPFQGSSRVGSVHEGLVGPGGVGAWCGGARRGGQEWGAVTRPRNELTMEVHPTVPTSSRKKIYFFFFHTFTF